MTHIISIDAGNGGVNAMLAKGNKSVYFPSIRATATGASLGLGEYFDLDYEYIDWYGRRFVVGDDVLRVNRAGLERHMGVMRSGNEFQQFMVAAAIARLGVKEGEVNLTLFAPPGVFGEMRPVILSRFTENNGEVEIRLKGDKKARKWRYDSVTVLPEGIGAACCFALDEKGGYIEGGPLDGQVVILDMGAQTLDALILHEGNFDAEAMEHATWEHGGLNQRIREPILRTLRNKGSDFDFTTVDDVDVAMRRGLLHGDYCLRVAGIEVDIQPLLSHHSEKYAEWISNTIIDSKLGGFRGVDSVILVGGGAVLTGKHLRSWYGKKILDQKQYPSARKIHPVDLNAAGGLRYALAMAQGV